MAQTPENKRAERDARKRAAGPSVSNFGFSAIGIYFGFRVSNFEIGALGLVSDFVLRVSDFKGVGWAPPTDSLFFETTENMEQWRRTESWRAQKKRPLTGVGPGELPPGWLQPALTV
jgi:hypothetical protein